MKVAVTGAGAAAVGARGAEYGVGGGTGAWGPELGRVSLLEMAARPGRLRTARKQENGLPSAPMSECQSPAVGARVCGLLEESGGQVREQKKRKQQKVQQNGIGRFKSGTATKDMSCSRMTAVHIY